MQIKNHYLLAGLISALLSAPLFADTADRCISLMDKRVENNTLNLSNCHLQPQQAQAILNYLSQHPTIKTLNIDDNPDFGSEGVAVLAQNNTLETLSFSYSEVGDEGFAALAKNTSIKHLVRRGGIDPSGTNYTDQAPSKLIGNTSLTSIF